MAKYILAGVGTGMGVNSAGELVVSGDTYTESSLSVEVTSEDIRGGLGNKILGKYFHDSVMNATLTDALFSLEYLSLKMGAAITVGSNGIVLESITTVKENEITVTETPVALEGLGVLGWWSYSGKDEWKKLTFEGKVAKVPNLKLGSEVCVKFCADKEAARQFVIPTNIIPQEITMILQYPLFRAGTTSLTQSYRVGTLEVKIPRFLPDPSIDMSLTAGGASTTNFSGTALPYKTTTGCQSDDDDYAIFTEIIDGTNWYDGLTTIAVDNADIRLKTTETTTLKLWGVYNDGASLSTKPLDNTKMTYTVTPSATATVSAEGLVTASAKGTATIKIVATDTAGNENPIEGYASITVE